MTWGPTDGNMKAADAHYSEATSPELGDRCACGGILEIKPTENCSCHISAPCGGCETAPLWCPECLEEIDQ